MVCQSRLVHTAIDRSLHCFGHDSVGSQSPLPATAKPVATLPQGVLEGRTMDAGAEEVIAAYGREVLARITPTHPSTQS